MLPNLARLAAPTRAPDRSWSLRQADHRFLEAVGDGTYVAGDFPDADVNAVDVHGTAALLYASRQGHVAIVPALLAAGANVNQANKYGDTALIIASYYGRTEIVKMLLAAGADVNKANKWGNTALMIAISYGHLAVVEMLLAKGADVDTANDVGDTVLMEASSNGRTEIVRLLLAHGADVNHVDNNGKTALMKASVRGRAAVVEMLLAHGANVDKVDKYGWTALVRASDKGHITIVALINDARGIRIRYLWEKAIRITPLVERFKQYLLLRFVNPIRFRPGGSGYLAVEEEWHKRQRTGAHMGMTFAQFLAMRIKPAQYITTPKSSPSSARRARRDNPRVASVRVEE
jgi:ankyrin repeat protein